VPLTCHAKVKYNTYGKRNRYLRFVLVKQWTAEFHWSPRFLGDLPHVVFRRTRLKPQEDTRVVYTGRTLVVGTQDRPSRAIESSEYAGPFNVSELLSLARSVAAGRAPKEAIVGWMEDNLPHPWSLLASEDSSSFFKGIVL